MNTIYNLTGKKSIEKEVKKMKKLFATVLAMALMFTGPMSAFAAFTGGPEKTIPAEADLSGMGSLLQFDGDFVYHDKDTSNVVAEGLVWEYANEDWKVAGQYVEVKYKANRPGWGIRVYNKNKADARWTDPNADEPDKPAGLISQSNPSLTIPLAWKAFDVAPTYLATVNKDTDFEENYTDPLEMSVGSPGTHAFYKELYQAHTVVGLEDMYYGKWCYMKDAGDEKWEDTNNDGIINDGDTIVSDFVQGDGYITFVNYLGLSTCTYSVAEKIIRSPAASPAYLTFAAGIKAATLSDTYDTVIYVQLYTE